MQPSKRGERLLTVDWRKPHDNLMQTSGCEGAYSSHCTEKGNGQQHGLQGGSEYAEQKKTREHMETSKPSESAGARGSLHLRREGIFVSFETGIHAHRGKDHLADGVRER